MHVRASRRAHVHACELHQWAGSGGRAPTNKSRRGGPEVPIDIERHTKVRLGVRERGGL
jgi:hypothetical protein